MADLWQTVRDGWATLAWPESAWLGPVATALAIAFVGWLVARTASAAVSRIARRRLDAQGGLIARLAVYYGVLGLFVATALQQVGVDLTVLVGAAGILSVAIGFAAQTSASNIISGLFLLGERPFVLGDVIEIEGEKGEVVGIDLLSVKLRTFANVLVRVPNETLLKANLRNLTHFPIRRFDLRLRVPYEADLARVREVLLQVAAAHPLCLDEPAAIVWFGDFEDHGTRLQFSTWSATPQYLELTNTLPDRVRAAFDAEGIAFAIPVTRWIDSSAAD